MGTAARLEGANKSLGTDILVSAATREGVGAYAVVRPRGTIKVKGRNQPVAVFELLGVTDEEDGETLPADRRCAAHGNGWPQRPAQLPGRAAANHHWYSRPR
jgi:hypothetical protein